MSVSVTVIADAVEVLIAALVPTVRPGWPFRAARGTEPIAKMPKDTSFDRSFRLVPSLQPVIGLDYGGTAREESQVLWLHVGYLSRQRDDDVTDRIASDQQQIVTALQTSGIGWPAELVNIFPEAGTSVTDVAAEGSNALLLAMPWRITYDVT